MPSELRLYAWSVEVVSPVSPEIMTFETRGAYVQEEGSYTSFKDCAHAAVAAYRTEFVLRIVRGPSVNHAV